MNVDDIFDASFERALGAQKTRDARCGVHTGKQMWGAAGYKVIFHCNSGFR
jgi:hypothetical protein